jgi:hypothetical protein
MQDMSNTRPHRENTGVGQIVALMQCLALSRHVKSVMTLSGIVSNDVGYGIDGNGTACCSEATSIVGAIGTPTSQVLPQRHVCTVIFLMYSVLP